MLSTVRNLDEMLKFGATYPFVVSRKTDNIYHLRYSLEIPVSVTTEEFLDYRDHGSAGSVSFITIDYHSLLADHYLYIHSYNRNSISSTILIFSASKYFSMSFCKNCSAALVVLKSARITWQVHRRTKKNISLVSALLILRVLRSLHATNPLLN